MKPSLMKTVLLGFGIVLCLAVPPGLAGEESVDAIQPVFIPPLDFFEEFRSDAEYGTGGGRPPRQVTVVTAEELTPSVTQRIVRELGDANTFCARIPDQEYAVDCLSYRLWLVAQSLPATGEYADVKVALDTAAAKLKRLALQNASPVLPRGVARSPQGETTVRPLVPVRTEALAEVNAQASAILDEAATVLLRSAQASEARRIPYQQIAAAVNSNKVLLRSL